MKRHRAIALIFAICVIALGGFAWHINSSAARNADAAGAVFALGYEAKFSNDDEFWMDGSNRDFVSRSNLSWWLKGDLRAIRIQCDHGDPMSVIEDVVALKESGQGFSSIVVRTDFFSEANVDVGVLESLVRITEYSCN